MKNQMKNLFPLTDPYRLLFMVGLVTACISFSLWLLFQLQIITYYPRFEHGDMLFMVFLWCFISGFLMTAIPKMTASFPTNRIEMLLFFTLAIIQLITILLHHRNWSAGIYILQIFLLISFVFRRIWVKKVFPFEGLYFIPFAFLSALLGGFLLAMTTHLQLVYLFIGKAFVLNLILGIGSRLIPVVTRTANAIKPDAQTPQNNKLKYFLLAIGLNLGFFIEGFYSIKVGNGIQFFIVLLVSHFNFKVFSSMTSFSVSGLGLKLGIGFLWIYYLLKVFIDSDSMNVATAHILYIGVFLLMTLMIATRVMLAHGGQGLNYETNSKKLGLVIALIGLSVLFRYIAGTDIMSLSMTVGISFILLGLILWGQKFCKILIDLYFQR